MRGQSNYELCVSRKWGQEKLPEGNGLSAKGGNKMIIKELLEYINENITDGVLSSDSEVIIRVEHETAEVTSLFNDYNELTISPD